MQTNGLDANPNLRSGPVGRKRERTRPQQRCPCGPWAEELGRTSGARLARRGPRAARVLAGRGTGRAVKSAHQNVFLLFYFLLRFILFKQIQ